MSEDEILNNDLKDIFELVRVHQEFNKAASGEQSPNEKTDYSTEEKYIDDILI